MEEVAEDQEVVVDSEVEEEAMKLVVEGVVLVEEEVAEIVVTEVLGALVGMEATEGMVTEVMVTEIRDL